MIRTMKRTATAIIWLLLCNCLHLTHSWTTTNLLPIHNENRRQRQTLGRLNVAAAPSEESVASQDENDLNSKQPEAHKRIYSMPALYDIAFGYRDYEEEVEFLLNQHAELAGFPARRILDVAAGPARHGVTALQLEGQQQGEQQGHSDDDAPLSITCVDLSPEMAQYAQELAIDELDDEQRANFQYITDDIRTLEQLTDTDDGDDDEDGNNSGNANSLFDSAWILLGSLQHLTRNEEVVQCFSRIHSLLRTGGTIVVELPHPRETFSMIDCTRNYWNVPLEDESEADSGELQIVWGDDDDEFDPITQVRQLTIEMKLTNVEETEDIQSVRGIVPTRLFTAQELNAIAALAGFRIPAMFGALEDGVSVSDEDAAFRMVCVLQKQ